MFDRMTVKSLRDDLAKLGPEHDHKEVKVWLPGSTLYLVGSPGIVDKVEAHGPAVLLEGNVEPGSVIARALDAWAGP